MTKQPHLAPKSLKERFFNFLTTFVLRRHFQRMKLAKQDTNYIEQQLMIRTNTGAQRIGMVTLQFVDGLTPGDKVAAAEAKIADLKARIATLEETIGQSTCALKEARVSVRDITGPFANELKPIDCAIELNNKVLGIKVESWADRMKNFNEKKFREEYLQVWSVENPDEIKPYSTVYANVLLLQEQIIGWKTGSTLWDSVGKAMHSKQLSIAHETFSWPSLRNRLSIRSARFDCNNVEEHNKAFLNAREFYKLFPIHPEFSGLSPHEAGAFIPPQKEPKDQEG